MNQCPAAVEQAVGRACVNSLALARLHARRHARARTIAYGFGAMDFALTVSHDRCDAAHRPRSYEHEND
jgi:hypothetical protein